LALPRDVGLGKDDFQKSLIFGETDSLVNYILNILLMRPGNLPSMPNIGINIGQYVQPHMSVDLDADLIKGLIVSNCEDLLPYLSTDDLIVITMRDEYNRDVLLIKIPIITEENKSQQDAYYAFYRNELNELEFNFLIDDEL
jgi:hypothetical protein